MIYNKQNNKVQVETMTVSYDDKIKVKVKDKTPQQVRMLSGTVWFSASF